MSSQPTHANVGPGDKLCLLLVLFGASLYLLTSQTMAESYRVADLVEGTQPSPADFEFRPQLLGGRLYFADNSRLWRLDAVDSTPVLIFELDPRTRIVEKELVALGSWLIFPADDSSYGGELWRTDGTPQGTELIADICRGLCSSDPKSLTVFQDGVYFSAWTPRAGRELFVTDGTPNGTQLVKDLVPGRDGAEIEFLAEAGGSLLFRTADALWGTTGNAAETGVIGQTPESWVSFRGDLYFTDGGPRLWRTDGTLEGTTEALDLRDSLVRIELLSASEDQLFFLGDQQLLYRTEGTDEGAVFLADVGLQKTAAETARLSTGHPFVPTPSTVFEQTLYLGINGNGTFDIPARLWRSDGTATGTFVVRDFASDFSARPEHFFAFDALYFSADDGSHGKELWKTDGTEQGTMLVADIDPTSSGNLVLTPRSSDPREFFEFNGQLLFSATDQVVGRELRLIDNVEVELFANLRDDAASSHLRTFAPLGVRVAVQGEDIDGRPFLWTSDGTQAGTLPVARLFQTNLPETVRSPMTRFGNAVLFSPLDSAFEPFSGELWITDGTNGATQLVKDIAQGQTWSQPDFVSTSDELAYFTANDGMRGTELWASDGTEHGTRIVQDLNRGPSGSRIYEVAQSDRQLFFTSEFGLHVKQHLLHRERARLLLDPSFRTTLLGAGNTRVFLVSFRQETGWEPWVSDGTARGTRLIKDINPGAETSPVSGARILGDALYLVADDGLHGAELWYSDGTEAGTRILLDVWPGAIGSFPDDLAVVGNELWFSANDGVHGRELWRTDGTPEGTVLIRDLRPGRGGSAPRLIHQLPSSSVVVFVASDGVHGDELWTSDGTTVGTHLLDDVLPGPASGVVSGFATAAGRVFFAGRDLERGVELWALPLDGE